MNHNEWPGQMDTRKSPPVEGGGFFPGMGWQHCLRCLGKAPRTFAQIDRRPAPRPLRQQQGFSAARRPFCRVLAKALEMPEASSPLIMAKAPGPKPIVRACSAAPNSAPDFCPMVSDAVPDSPSDARHVTAQPAHVVLKST